MTKLTFERTNSFFATQADRPEGAIKSLQEIREYDFGKQAFVWEVAQGGYITKYELLERFHAAKHEFGRYMSSAFLPATVLRSSGKLSYNVLYLEQAGIHPTDTALPETCNDFQTFFTEEHAQDYSEYLKNNEEYIACVAAFHAMNMRFSEYDY
jgi:hypothetical protein